MKLDIRTHRLLPCAAAFCFCILSAQAGVKRFRGNSDDYSFPGGTWDCNNTAQWMDEGSTTQVPWTDAGDIALIVNWTNAWGSTTMLVDDSYGVVEASGIVVTNDMGAPWQYNYFNGAPLRIGADGVTIHTDTPNTFVDFNCPVVLTSPQTWRNAKVRQMDVGGTVTFTNVLSSAPGVSTPITFDGFNRIDPSVKAMTHDRTTFAFKNDNTYSGSTTVQNGGVLYLVFSSAFSGSKLDSSSALILSGGGLAITGSSMVFTQAVSSLVVKAGENFIGGKNANAVFDCGDIVRDGIGGTASFPISWSGGTTAYANNANTDGILGGWALLAEGAFASMDTGTRRVGQNSGSDRTTTDSWGGNEHIKVMGGGVRTLGDVAVHSVRYQARVTPAPTNDLADATLTIKTGGLAVNNVLGCKLANGKLRSGFETGELFVFTAGPFEISSRIEDNGDTPLVLIKAQSGTLTLSGEIAYTGDTYLNGGTLSLVGNGAGLFADVHQSGGTTLQLANGARLSCGGAGRVLGGNLALGEGAVLDLEVGAKDGGDADIVPLTLDNRFASFTTTATIADPVTVAISVPSGADLRRRAYRLIEWAPGVTVAGLATDAFDLVMPCYADGSLVVSAEGLDLVVTRILKGTLLIVE
ncbi:MAG: autotransporter-associated beta strand repeat-containing protein [Kiritimatiellia bacterium]